MNYGQYKVPPANEFVKFGVGQPAPSMLPLDIMRYGFQDILEIQDPLLLQYGDIPGYKQFRQSLADFLAKQYKNDVEEDELFVTNGVTGALAMFCSIFTETGTTVYVEEPTYFLALNIFKNDFRLNCVSVPIEEDGINLDILEEELKNGDPTKLRFLYTIPTFHNPTNYTMSHEKRVRLASLAETYDNFIIVADEVYQMLYFKDQPPAPLCYYTDKAISLGSFSKILAPALRLGWMQIRNKDIMNKFLESGQMDSSGGFNPIIQSLVHNIIDNGYLEDNIAFCCATLTDKYNALYKAVNEQLGDYVTCNRCTGGYFLWIKLNNLKAANLLEKCLENKVHFHPGEKFSATGGCQNYMRLSFSYYETDGLILGIQRIKKVLEDNRLRIGVVGYKGRLGDRIMNINGYKFVGIDRDMNIPNTDVIIDVSSPQGTKDLVDELFEQEKTIPLIIGTTGDLPLRELDAYSDIAPVAIISNFSFGIPQFLELVDNIDKDKWQMSMEEHHHINKIDAPSGTAKTIKSRIGEDIEIESKREGDIIGIHTLTLDRDNEQLSITHTAKDRDLFANGALEYCKWILNKEPNLYYGMEKDNKVESNEIKFSKYSGCGNDFIMIDLSSTEYYTSDRRSELVQKLCPRATSVGADGVIFAEYSNKLYWEYYNSDGTCVEMCGNGLRCVVQWALDNYNINKEVDLEIENGYIKSTAIFTDDGFHVSMPYPVNRHKKLMVSSYVGDCYKVGVPHVVIPVSDEIEFEDITLAGMHFIANAELTNTNMYYKVDDNTYEVRTYERGVCEETLACGSGCCAVAYHIWLNERCPEKTYTMRVKSGEELVITVSQDELFLKGSAKKIYDGMFTI